MLFHPLFLGVIKLLRKIIMFYYVKVHNNLSFTGLQSRILRVANMAEADGNQKGGASAHSDTIQ